jgi:hypothetical protein
MENRRMKMTIITMSLIPGLLLCLLLIGFTQKITMTRTQDSNLKSRPEMTNYEETSHYEDVIRFISELQIKTDNLRLESFGRTEEGRDLPLMIFANPPIAQPRDARASNKTIVFIQANIHAGEVEGKEAMLHLSRRIANGDLKPLLENLIILIAPIYNADGNERISLENRTAQNGPISGVGIRENAKGYDLNRDYMKLETPEANALVGLFNRWDPHLIVDLHTTNGSYHGYHLTYAPTLNPNSDARLIAFERNKMLPTITRAMLKIHKFRTYYYGNFATKERINRELDSFEIERSGRTAQPSNKPETKVWRTFDHRPRFGNNYCGLRNRLTILSEAYSYLDFKGRIDVTEAFVEEILRYSSLHAEEISSLIKRVDNATLQGRIGEQGIAFDIKGLDKLSNILVGETEKIKNPRSGKMMTAMIESKFHPTPMLDYGLFIATKTAQMPHAYLFQNNKGMKVVISKLLAHGIAVEELTQPLNIEVESFKIEDVKKASRTFQDHNEIKLKGHSETETINFPIGSLMVRTSQTSAPLIFYLLEPETDDGFVNWNFLDAYLEKGKNYPIFKLKSNVRTASRLL